MNLFLVKRAANYISFLIMVILLEVNVAHVSLKKYNESEKISKYSPVSIQHLKLKERYISFLNNAKNSNKNIHKDNQPVSFYFMKKNEKSNKASEEDYQMISTSNTNTSKNHLYETNEKLMGIHKTPDFYNHTDLVIPLFVPCLTDDNKLNTENIKSFLYNSCSEKRKALKPIFSFKKISKNGCGVNNESVKLTCTHANDVHVSLSNKITEINGKVEKIDSDLDPISKLAKFLGLFTIVQFTNEICTDGSDNMYGTCYHYVECNRLGGKAKGSCAQGHGVCCYVELTCGHRTNANAAYFTGGSFFNTSEQGVYGCSLVIDKSDPSVKQLRLDFVNFQIAGPLDGNCQIDRFIVSGQNYNNILPEICGDNNGQHIYIDVDAVLGPVMLAVLSSGANGLPETFSIHIQQLREKSVLLAPSNCLQYHLTTSGVIKSFNYQNNFSAVIRPGYMNKLNYAVCIKKQSGYCEVTYSNKAKNGTEMVFELNNLDDEGIPTVPEGEAGAESYNCPDDYIVLNNMRLCGHRLNDAFENSDLKQNHVIKVADNGPFVITVKTNNNVTGRGFYLIYHQNPCVIE
ncbi:uncharacterized protein LOC142323420 [Lycorma delicatula]|uniref:uncharacterized protein LOC142323420 n=1 Tax=Lycorma delicatula TaxID=130591 RepID=UPI003F519490